MKEIGIYIHIPFCKKKCSYCDFTSFENVGTEVQDRYMNLLINEINNFKESKDRVVTTIYFGGGTPSYIKQQHIRNVLDVIKKRFNVKEDAEITLELNPGTANKEKLEYYKESGINRLSIGLQSTNNEILKTIGRIHTFEEFLDTYNLARKIGFKNINIDLMLGLPNQTLDELMDSVNKVINLNPEHISIYSLILEENTDLFNKVKNNIYQLPEENIERKMYWESKKAFEKAGYIQYEISNYSKKGYESKHNVNCWFQKEYLGFGLAAHSFYNEVRYKNTENLQEYLKFENIKIIEEANRSREDIAKEYMMLGLRMLRGISISEFQRKFEINPLFYFRFELSKLTDLGLIEVDLDSIKLTKKGLDFANIVFEEFI